MQTKIAKSLSQKNESENENNFTQMSHHLKYEDPTLSNQQVPLNYLKMVETQNQNICTQ